MLDGECERVSRGVCMHGIEWENLTCWVDFVRQRALAVLPQIEYACGWISPAPLFTWTVFAVAFGCLLTLFHASFARCQIQLLILVHSFFCPSPRPLHIQIGEFVTLLAFPSSRNHKRRFRRFIHFCFVFYALCVVVYVSVMGFIGLFIFHAVDDSFTILLGVQHWHILRLFCVQWFWFIFSLKQFKIAFKFKFRKIITECSIKSRLTWMEFLTNGDYDIWFVRITFGEWISAVLWKFFHKLIAHTMNVTVVLFEMFLFSYQAKFFFVFCVLSLEIVFRWIQFLITFFCFVFDFLFNCTKFSLLSWA